jgi:hypothetical protein
MDEKKKSEKKVTFYITNYSLKTCPIGKRLKSMFCNFYFLLLIAKRSHSFILLV